MTAQDSRPILLGPSSITHNERCYGLSLPFLSLSFSFPFSLSASLALSLPLSLSSADLGCSAGFAASDGFPSAGLAAASSPFFSPAPRPVWVRAW